MLDKKQLLYWRRICSKTPKEVGIFELGGGMLAIVLAWIFKIAKKDELLELVFLTIGTGLFGAILGFLFRVVFITPVKMYDELEAKLAKYECLIIHSATWGIANIRTDVTETVQAHIINGRLEMECGITVLGDPTPGVPKILTVEYSFGGERSKKTFPEHAIAGLP